VYNPLKKLVRRIKGSMRKLQSIISVIMVTIPIGFGLIFVAAQQSGWILRILLGVVGFGLLFYSAWEYRKTQKKIDDEEEGQKKKEDKRHKELISAVNNLAQIMTDRKGKPK